MIIFIILCVLATTLGVPLNSDEGRSNEHYVLPGESAPTLYDVILFLNPDYEESFHGSVKIRIIPAQNTQSIVLHAMELNITSITLNADANPNINLIASYQLASDDTHFLRIQTNQQILAQQPYNLDISYVGKYSQNMFGIYISTYQYMGETQKLITSQLQPTYARRVFPCYDEPHQKAIFRTTIYVPPRYNVVVTNMPPKTNSLKPEVQDFVKYEFEDTPIMSTYLLAYLVSTFNNINNVNAGQNQIYSVPFTVYSRPGTQESAKFALEFGQQNMVALEDYMQFKYILPKFDKVAVPDFGAGAMENWGLVVYREVALLVTDGVTTTSTKQNVGRIICHENMHMWFGNEVSPRSWTYTWLNEGFANFFENFGTDLVLPEWEMMEQYVLLVQNVFQNDAVLNVNPMTHPVYTPSEIIGTFNAVAYQKSGSVIRMMQHFLTPEVFREGIAIYIRKKQAIRPSELYEAMQQAINNANYTLGLPLSVIMNRWTLQGGFPVVTARKQAPSANSISFHQVRYLTDTSLSSDSQWHIPINVATSTNPDFTDTKPQFWLGPGTALSADIIGLNQAQWFIVNKQQTGYYRVNYDEDNWRALAKVLQESPNVIHKLNRAQLIDDSFNLARNGRLGYVYAFELSRYLVNETEYIPWGSANAAYEYLDVALSGSSAYELFQTYVLQLSEPIYNQLGFEAISSEKHVTAFHRNIILNLNCRLGNERCTNTSQQLLEDLRDNNRVLNPDIQNLVFCSGLRGGSSENFNFLWNRFQASEDSSEQSILLNALGCTSNVTLRDFYLSQVLDDNSPIRNQDKHSVIVSAINSSPANMEAALDFVLEHFAEIQPRVQQLTGTSNILNAFGRRLTTQGHSNKIDVLAARYDAILSAGDRAAIAGIRENINAAISWNERNYNIAYNWLKDNYGNNANILTSSFLVIVALFIASLF